MATFTVQQVTRLGIVPVYNTANDLGDAYLNDGKVWVAVSDGTGELIITFVSSLVVGTMALADLTVTIAQNTEQVIGMFPENWFSDGDGLVQMRYSKHESVVIAVMKR